MIRVAVDAMGGDKAPQAEIAGVLQALASLPESFVVQLVGRAIRRVMSSLNRTHC